MNVPQPNRVHTTVNNSVLFTSKKVEDMACSNLSDKHLM